MSLVHIDKSVITFHFKEILEDGLTFDPWSLAGLGAMLVAPILLKRRDQNHAIPLNVWIEQARQTSSPHFTLAQQNHHTIQPHSQDDHLQKLTQQVAA